MRPHLVRSTLCLAVLLVQAVACRAYTSLPLPNGDVTTFASGVATDWSPFATGPSVPAGLSYFADDGNFRSAPYSQGIGGIDAALPLGSLWGAGLTRQVSATPGKIYLLAGYQDIFEPLYLPPPARRYAHFFGIDPYGSSTPPPPFTTGGVEWMGHDQWFYNDAAGNSTQVGGMHRCISAWPARSGVISLWSGVYVYGDAPASIGPTVFDIDAFSLYEFDNPTQTQLQNVGFEAVENLTPGLDANDISRISLPSAWIPIGGGIGQKESYYTEAVAKRSGAAGLRIYNHRGCLTRGVMQRVAKSGAWRATFSVWIRSNKALGAVAMVGIDPSGGDDINSSAIAWSTYSRTDEAWEQISVTAPCSPAPITVFLAETIQPGTTGNMHYADFDDAALVFDTDQTPPEPFTVTSDSLTTLQTYLAARISPAPRDPESGIASLQYAIGTTAGGQDIRPYTLSPNPGSVSATGLALTTGATYYITVRATNGVGLSTTASSGPIVCAPRPNPYTWSNAEHLSQSAYSADNPRLAAGPSSEVYAVWRESSDVTWDGANPKVVFRRRSGTAWDSPIPIATGSQLWWPDVAAADGNPIVSYVSPGDSLANDLRIARFHSRFAYTDELALTDVSAFPKISYSPSAGGVVGCIHNTTADPAMGVACLALKKPGWTAEPLPGAQYSSADTRIRVACYGAYTHIVWGRLDGSQPGLYYCVRDAYGSYSTPRLIAQGVGVGDVAVGPSGDVSIVYEIDGLVWFTRSGDGTFPDPPVCLGAGEYPSVETGPDSRAHVLFFAPAPATNENGVQTVLPTHMFLDGSGWSLPKAICAPSCTSGIWAQEPGNLAVGPSGGLHFAWSHNPHDRGWQGGQFQGYYWIDYHTTTPTAPQPSGIGAAKLWGDDAPAALLGYPPSKTVALANKQVTATGTFAFRTKVGGSTEWRSVPYLQLQEQDSPSGIRVIAGDAQISPTADIGIVPGDVVEASGVISTINGTRTLGYLTPEGIAQGVGCAKTGMAAQPVRVHHMQIASLGGVALGPTPGATGALGPNNTGLLVSVSGIVQTVSADERGVKVIYVDDGLGVACGESIGCKVYDPYSPAMSGDFVTVIGISTVELYDPSPALPGDESYIRALYPRDELSVLVLGHPEITATPISYAVPIDRPRPVPPEHRLIRRR